MRECLIGADACDLPMADGAVLTLGNLGKTSVCADRHREGLALRNTVDMEKSEARKIRRAEILRFHQGTKCIRTLIAKALSIRGTADTKAVHNHQKYTFDFHIVKFPLYVKQFILFCIISLYRAFCN